VIDFCKVILWFSLVLSFVLIVASPFLERADRTHRSDFEVAESNSKLVFELDWTLNRWFGAPTTLVLSAGFLAVVYVLEETGRRLAKAVEVGPDATAQAMRRAVRPAPAVEHVVVGESRALRATKTNGV
jgi:hypothetical protein